jgi:hypothetical protein
MGINRCVWPALCGTGYNYGPFTSGYVPMGARWRLSASWYNANRSKYSTVVQGILDGLRYYGMINTDWYGFGYMFSIDGTQDSRWIADDVWALKAIPVSAFELIDTVQGQYTFTGPPSLKIGALATFTLQYRFPQNPSYQTGIYVSYSLNGGSAVGLSGSPTGFTTGHPGPVTCSFTPSAPGTYQITATTSSGSWLQPMPLTYTI